jgi:hypothetical protein
MNIVKESIAETSDLKLVRTKIGYRCLYEILTKRKDGEGLSCFVSRDEEEARKKFTKLKREMV